MLAGNGDGTFDARLDYPTGDRPHGVALGRMNGDTHVDVVVADSLSHTVSVLLGNGDGTLGAVVTLGGVPRPVITRLATELARIARLPEVAEKFREDGSLRATSAITRILPGSGKERLKSYGGTSATAWPRSSRPATRRAWKRC